MSDLVKRLRKYANMPYSGPIHDTCGEAADEIDRLRGALEKIADGDIIDSLCWDIAREALKDDDVHSNSEKD